jgi:hypothetical protein
MDYPMSLKQISFLQVFTFLASTTMMSVAVFGHDPFSFGCGVFSLIGNQLGLISLLINKRRSLPNDN